MTTNDIDAIRRIPVAAEPGNNTFVVWYDPNNEPYAVYFRSDTNAWDDDQRWFNADQAGGDLDGPYSWDNLREELRGNDGPHRLVPGTKVDELTAELAEAREQAKDSAYAASQARKALTETRAALAEVRAQLTAANRRNDGLQNDLDSATKANTAWANQVARVEREHGDTIDDRDYYQQTADNLAEAIAKLTGVEIGEHSSMNNPWDNALQAATEAAEKAGAAR